MSRDVRKTQDRRGDWPPPTEARKLFRKRGLDPWRSRSSALQHAGPGDGGRGHLGRRGRADPFLEHGAGRVFGFSESEALDQFPRHHHTREPAPHWAGYDETMRTGQTRYGAGDVLALPAIHKNGSRISVEFTIVPFRDASGAMMGIAAVLRDVTKRFEESRRLRRQTLSLERRGASGAPATSSLS